MSQSPFILLVAFVVTVLVVVIVNLVIRFLFLNYQRERKSNKQLRLLRERYEKEVLTAKLEIQEQTQRAIAQDLHDNVNLSIIMTKMSLQLINQDNVAD